MTSYRHIDSPLGTILLRAQGAHLTGLFFAGQKYHPAGIADSRDVPPADAAVLDRAASELAEYFAGRRDTFTVPVRFTGSPFQQRVWEALLAIPCGETASYGELARALGLPPTHARAVGGNAKASAPRQADRADCAAMPRLFIAVEVPPEQAAWLLSTLPPAHGVRPAAPEQVHLTLHFLGECNVPGAALEAALDSIRAPAFLLQAAGTGRFRSGQGSVLWAGLAPGPGLDALRALHADVGQALAEAAGISPERRRFHPHLTLARCKPSVPESVLRAWLDTHRTLASEPWHVQRLVLFESRLGPQGPQHLVRQAWALTQAGPTPGC